MVYASENSRDRRADYRYPASDERGAARIKIGEQEWPAAVLDESASGFSIEVAAPLECTAGQSIYLLFDEAWMQCTVRHVGRRNESPRDEQDTGDRIRLGLLRVQELFAAPTLPSVPWHEALARRAAALLDSPGEILILLGGLLAFVAVAAIALNYQVEGDGTRQAQRTERITRRAKIIAERPVELRSSDAPRRTRVRPPGPRPSGRAPAGSDSARSRGVVSTQVQTPREEPLDRTSPLPRVPVGLLIEEPIAKELRLTAAQRTELAQLAARSSATARDQAGTDPEAIEQTLGEIDTAALALLNPEQMLLLRSYLARIEPQAGTPTRESQAVDAR